MRGYCDILNQINKRVSQDYLTKFDNFLKSLDTMDKLFIDRRSDAEELISVTKEALN